MLFFQEPNHKRMTFKLFFLLMLITLSTKVKSNFPSVGSINSQYTGVRIVFRFMALNFAHVGRIYSRLEALELPNSPPRIKKGLFCTISCAVPPFFTRYGGLNVCD